MRLFYIYLLASCLASPAALAATYMSQGKFSEGEAALAAARPKLVEITAKEITENYSVANIAKILSPTHPSAADQAYLEHLKKTFHPAKEMAPKVSIEGSKILVTLADGKKVTVIQSEKNPNLFTVNGREFRYDPKQSLEGTLNTLAKLIDESLYSKPKHSMYKWILPDAEAIGSVGVGHASVSAVVAATMVGPLIERFSSLSSVKNSYETMSQLCENRDSTVPYKDSLLSRELQELRVAQLFDADDTKPLDCKKYVDEYVKNGPTGIGVLKLQIQGSCDAYNRLADCVAKYRRESEPTPPGTPSGTPNTTE